MKVVFELNILLDVMQQREPFYKTSAAALSKSLNGDCTGMVAGHVITSLHYMLVSYANKQKADDVIDFLLEKFQVVNADRETFQYARQLPIKDFEDAVVAAIAAKSGCDFIVTRNVTYFKQSPVMALLPEEFLERLK